MISFDTILREARVSSQRMLVLRNSTADLGAAVFTVADERPDLFRAYQHTQGDRVKAAMTRASIVASFIGHSPKVAVFVQMYEVAGYRPMTQAEYQSLPEHLELFEYGYGRMEDRDATLAFDLRPLPHFAEWKGRLVIGWPGREVGWHRWADQNTFPVVAIHEDSLLRRHMPEWHDLVLTWQELKSIPAAWGSRLSQWRGIYFIFDVAQRQGYVGSASGADNLLGRWSNYASSGHGGNKRLRTCNPADLRFSILQRTSPDTPREEVEKLERAWKVRLHTREYGLNDN